MEFVEEEKCIEKYDILNTKICCKSNRALLVVCSM